ncbi:hypothetical protein BJ170DRAFT_136580 [Xylariales sp. AK1849]|nr:hypothetical protein BJ170DRAFT_136580 [Xylariales sp. AK1849]
MSSALVWVPAGKYDSVAPLWQDQYVWSALPVDGSLPLHQTSFIDINEKEAASTRSRANTASSQSGLCLPLPEPTTSSADVRDEARGQETLVRTRRHKNEGSSMDSLSQADAKAHLREIIKKSVAPRPVSTTGLRLHSFHLAKTKSNSKPNPVKPEAVTQLRANELERQPQLDSTDGLVVPSEHPEDIEGAVAVNVASQNPKLLRPSRCRDGDSAAGEDFVRPASDKVRRFTLTNDCALPPAEVVNRGPPKPTKRSRHMSVRLDLNLDVEVQLHVTIRGSLTLSLFH